MWEHEDQIPNSSFVFFRTRHSIVRVQGQATEKRKAGQQRQPATENARPYTRTNAGHEKTGARRNSRFRIMWLDPELLYEFDETATSTLKWKSRRALAVGVTIQVSN